MLNGKNKCKVGNIYESNTLEHIYSNRIMFEKNKYCAACWAKPLCGGCVVQKFYNKENEQLNDYPNKLLCVNIRKDIEKLLSIIFQIRNDSELWNQLLNKIKHQYVI